MGELDAVADRELLRAVRDEQPPRARRGERGLGLGEREMAARLGLATPASVASQRKRSASRASSTRLPFGAESAE